MTPATILIAATVVFALATDLPKDTPNIIAANGNLPHKARHASKNDGRNYYTEHEKKARK